MANLQHHSEDEDHEPVPAVTTPQGTLAHSVEHGHEERDVNFKPLAQWGIGLAVTIILAHLVTLGIYQFLYKTENAAYTQPFFAQRTVPPEPRLLPNPADTARVPQAAQYRFQKFETLQGPGDYAATELHRDQAQLAQLGLFNLKEGLPEIPDALVSAVGGAAAGQETEGHEVGPGLSEMMPADPSGGMTLENRLR